MTTWQELIKGRTLQITTRNSADMVQCRNRVLQKFPLATLRPTGKDLWTLFNGAGAEALSNPHNSHYACWAEARKALDVADHS